MKCKKVKRMCSVKGCNCTDTFAITKTSEFGGVIMCETCLKEALSAIDNGGKFEPDVKTKANNPLFYHPNTTESKPGEGGDDDVAAIRAKGKEFNIRNYHNMGVEKLKATIAEIEATWQGGGDDE